MNDKILPYLYIYQDSTHYNSTSFLIRLMKQNISKFLIIGFFTATIMASAVPSVAQSEKDGIPTLREQKDREGYIIDLMDLIKKSKRKIERVNDKLEEQARYRRNLQREEKAREYYDKAMTFFEDGKLKEAQKIWKKAIKITEHPEMKGFIRDSVRKTKKQEKALMAAEQERLRRLEIERGFSAKEVSKTYSEGVRLFKQKKYLESKITFDRVEEMFPDHKATRSYLMIVEQEITREQQDLIEKQLNKEATARKKEKDEWRRELEEREKEREKNVYDQANDLYREAVKLHKAKQFVLAKEKFEEVEWVIPNYKSTVKYLKRIDKDIRKYDVLTKEEKQRLFEKQVRGEHLAKERDENRKRKEMVLKEKEKMKRLQEEADFVYDSAVALYKKGKYVQAQEKFIDVEDILPNYRGTEKYLKRISKKFKKMPMSPVKQLVDERERDREFVASKVERTSADAQKHEEQFIQKAVQERYRQYEDEATAKYKDAIHFYKGKNYTTAKSKFIQVEAIYPGYKDTLDYLSRIDDLILKQEPGVSVQMAAVERGIKDTLPSMTQKKQLRQLYKEAVGYYKSERYNLAQVKFRELRAQKLNYKATDKYLMKIDKKLAARAQQEQKQLAARSENELLSHYRSAIQLYKARQYTRAREKFLEVQSLGGYKATDKYLKKIARLLKDSPTREKIVDEKADALKPLYEIAVEHYKSREYALAQDKFLEIQRTDRDYKATSIYLRKINEKLGGKSIQGQVVLKPQKDIQETVKEEPKLQLKPGKIDKKTADIYNRGRDLYKTKRYMLAKEKFEEVLAVSPEHKKSLKYLRRIDKKIEKQKKVARVKKVIPQAKEEGVEEKVVKIKAGQLNDETYQVFEEAVNLYKQQEYVPAKEKFKHVAELAPGHRLTTRYLKGIDKKIAEQKIMAKIEKKLTSYELKDKEWHQKQEERVAILKAKEEHLKTLKGMRYKEFRQEVQRERLAVERIRRERKRLAQQKKEAMKRSLEDDEGILEKEKRNLLQAKLKEQSQLEREWKKDEEHRKRELKLLVQKEIKKLKADIGQAYKQSLELYRKDKVELSRRRLLEVETMLNDDVLEEKYVQKMRKRIERDQAKKRIYSGQQKDSDSRSKIARKKDKRRIEKLRQKEIKRLQKKIAKEERLLAREMKAEEKKRLKNQLDQDNRELEDTYDDVMTEEEMKAQPEERKLSEKERREELERLVKERQKELRKERDKVRREFDESLRRLYTKAVKLFKTGSPEKARNIFTEINEMRPGYKSTKKYISRINKQLKQQPIGETFNRYRSTYVTNASKQHSDRQSVISDAMDKIERQLR